MDPLMVGESLAFSAWASPRPIEVVPLVRTGFPL
jgi:hypothetical protein